MKYVQKSVVMNVRRECPKCLFELSVLRWKFPKIYHFFCTYIAAPNTQHNMMVVSLRNKDLEANAKQMH